MPNSMTGDDLCAIGRRLVYLKKLVGCVPRFGGSEEPVVTHANSASTTISERRNERIARKITRNHFYVYSKTFNHSRGT